VSSAGSLVALVARVGVGAPVVVVPFALVDGFNF
jgi:hypothetical protein